MSEEETKVDESTKNSDSFDNPGIVSEIPPPTTTIRKQDATNATDLRASLLASLIGEDTIAPSISAYRSYHENHLEVDEEEDEDLFGRIIVHDSGPSKSNNVHRNVLPPLASSLLSNSGLLETHQLYGASSGLFDAIDAEEQQALQLAKQRQVEEDERRRKQQQEEEKRRQEALEEAIKKEQERIRLVKEHEEQLRLLKEKEEESHRRLVQLQQEEKRSKATTSPKTSVIMNSGMQDLKLNDSNRTSPLSYGPYENVSIHSHSIPTTSMSSVDAPFIGNTTITIATTNPVSQSGFLAHIADSKLSHLQQQQQQRNVVPSIMTPVENLPTSTLQQAGYGWASYYYSTSGNSMQQMQRSMNPIPHTQQQQRHPLVSNTNPNLLSSGPTYTNTLVPTNSSFKQQQHTYSSSNTGVVGGEDGLSYAQRSQMRHNTSYVSSVSSSSNSPLSSQPTHTSSTATPSRLLASKTAGMHNTPSYATASMIHSNVTTASSSKNNSSKNMNGDVAEGILFGPITVTDPILVQSPGLFAGPPYWTYAITVWQDENINNNKPNHLHADKPAEKIHNISHDAKMMISTARRRFRHFVALEERLRRECPGAILPPRPDKHAIRAFEEATASQSAEFAQQRAMELEVYLNELRLHPIAGHSSVLKLFLTLPDHIGVAWPEVSSSIITRLSELGTSAAVKVAEGASQVLSELNSDYQAAAGEDNAEILAMASSEGLRIASVLQAVPKLEGIVFLLHDHGEKIGICGLECQKLAIHDLHGDKDMSTPFDILSAALLLSGRKMKALAADLGKNIVPFQSQYKLCRYESMAFGDRRSALARRRDARKEADNKAQKLVSFQHSLNTMGKIGVLEKMEMEAALADECAVDAVREADEIARTLQREVRRINEVRLKEWSSNISSIVHGFCQCSHEEIEIWENCRDDFFKEYPFIHQSYLSSE